MINYFDKYPVFAGKYVDYLKFRKVYIMITQGKHLESKGVKKIRKISKSMEKFNSSYGDMYKISPTGAEPPLTLMNFPSPLVVAIIGGFFLDSFSFMYNYFPLLCAADYSTLVMTGIDINFTLCLSPSFGCFT